MHVKLRKEEAIYTASLALYKPELPSFPLKYLETRPPGRLALFPKETRSSSCIKPLKDAFNFDKGPNSGSLGWPKLKQLGVVTKEWPSRGRCGWSCWVHVTKYPICMTWACLKAVCSIRLADKWAQRLYFCHLCPSSNEWGTVPKPMRHLFCVHCSLTPQCFRSGHSYQPQILFGKPCIAIVTELLAEGQRLQF